MKSPRDVRASSDEELEDLGIGGCTALRLIGDLEAWQGAASEASREAGARAEAAAAASHSVKLKLIQAVKENKHGKIE